MPTQHEGRPGPSPDVPDLAAAKTALRDQLVTARNRLSVAEIAEAAERLAAHVLDLPEVRRAASVSAYVSVGEEPGTSRLLDALLAAGKRVVLPLTISDRNEEGRFFLDLDWAVYTGPASLAPARYGLLEPTSPPLGRDAIATPDALLLPGMAVSPHGYRIGKGAGCYDRALSRVPVGTFTCVLLYDDEVGRDVPVGPHDRSVLAAATPSGITRF